MSVRSARSWLGTERLLARSMMVINALFLVVVGLSLLTTPVLIPVTVGLWLGAAAIVGLALLTPLER